MVDISNMQRIQRCSFQSLNVIAWKQSPDCKLEGVFCLLLKLCKHVFQFILCWSGEIVINMNNVLISFT